MTEKGATIRQVAAMVTARVGWTVGYRRVEELKRWLLREGHLEKLPVVEDREAYDPVAVDRIAGEAWRKRPGWTLRGHGSDGLFEAIVPAMGEGDGIRRMLLPKRRLWNRATGDWEMVVPDVVELYVYPTAEPCGSLTWTGDMEDGLPVYVPTDRISA